MAWVCEHRTTLEASPVKPLPCGRNQASRGRALSRSRAVRPGYCYGDIRHPREGRPRRRRGVRFCGGSPAAAESLTTPPATALRPEGPCSARVRCCRDCPAAAAGGGAGRVAIVPASIGKRQRRGGPASPGLGAACCSRPRSLPTLPSRQRRRWPGGRLHSLASDSQRLCLIIGFMSSEQADAALLCRTTISIAPSIEGPEDGCRDRWPWSN